MLTSLGDGGLAAGKKRMGEFDAAEKALLNHRVARCGADERPAPQRMSIAGRPAPNHAGRRRARESLSSLHALGLKPGWQSDAGKEKSP